MYADGDKKRQRHTCFLVSLPFADELFFLKLKGVRLIFMGY